MKKVAMTFLAICMIIALGISFYPFAAQATSQLATNFSSPEATWNEFKKALSEGNYDMALECCFPSERKKINRYKKLGAVKTNRILKTMKSIEKVFQDEETAKYMLHRDAKGRNFTTYISFAKIDNQWKINKY